MSDDIAVIVLAAGMGTRLKSALPKVLHKAGGRSLIGHVLNCAKELNPSRICVVTGPDMADVESEAVGLASEAKIVHQLDRQGTGHAVMQAEPVLAGFSGKTLVLYGDVPLIKAETLTALLDRLDAATPMAVLGFEAADAHGYGRLITTADDRLLAIREQLDASPEECAISLCNSGVIAIDNNLLWRLIKGLSNDNAKKEYYLTDLVGLANAEGAQVGFSLCDEEDVLGVNDRAQLAQVEALFQRRYRNDALMAGVGMADPAQVYLSHDTVFGKDVIVHPFVVIGPGVAIGDGSEIHSFSHLQNTRIGEGTSIGPYARLRGNVEIGNRARIGNFVEMKNAVLGDGAKASHLSYVGDAWVGAAANIGAGTITCNYDGFQKSRTVIGEGSFIGSNSALVAPLEVGPGTIIGAGSVVTKDVPADAITVTRAEQRILPDKARQSRQRKAAAKAARKQQET